MGYISQKLDLSGGWYPSSRLWRHAAAFISFNLGFALIFYMEVEWNVHGLRPESGVPYLLYLVVVLIAVNMAMNFLFTMKVVGLMRQTRGMDVRTFKDADGEGLAEEIERVLREGGHHYDVLEPPGGFIGFFSLNSMYHRWYRARNGDLRVVVGRYLGSPGIPVFVGPKGLLNTHLVEEIQRALDERFVKEEGPVTEEPSSKDVATGSPVVLPVHQE